MSEHSAEKDVCPQWCLNRLAPQCVIHRPSAEKDAGWFIRLMRRLRDRHPDGTEHTFQRVPLGMHACEAMSYCHHWRGVCDCGAERVLGYSVEEIR